VYLCKSVAVAKALRRVAEGKAAAQAEAMEWKRKYELESAQKQQSKIKGQFIHVQLQPITIPFLNRKKIVASSITSRKGLILQIYFIVPSCRSLHFMLILM
jgi:hypothetical protein